MAGHQLRQTINAGKMFAGFLGVGCQLDAISLLQGQAQLQGINGIQPQAINKQWLGRVDIVNGNVFQVQCVDYKLLQLGFSAQSW